MPSSRISKAGVIIALGSLYLIVFLLAGEIISRSTGAYKTSAIAYDKTVGWRFVKRLHEHHYSNVHGKEIVFSTNRRGFRDGEHEVRKKDGVKRILFLGDSYTAGAGLDSLSDEDLFTRLFALQHALQREYEVLNASCPAWATDQELLFLRNEGVAYKPDYVFLMVSPNDIRESYVKSFFILDENGGLRRHRGTALPWQERLCWFLSTRSSAYQFMQKTVFKTDYGSFSSLIAHFPVFWNVAGTTSPDSPLFLTEPTVEVEKAWQLFEALLLEMRDVCRKEKCRLVVSVLPAKMEFNGTLADGRYRQGVVSERVQGFAQEHGILFLDLFSRLKENERPLDMFIPEEFHLSVRGHRWVAQQIYSFFSALEKE